MAKVAIIGGGLAGTSCLYVFQKAWIECVLFEAADALAAGASGNPVGLYNPRFFAEKIPAADFYADAFLSVCELFQETGTEIDHSAHGSVHLITSPEKEVRFQKMKESWGWADDLMVLLSPEDASRTAAIEVAHKGLYLPTSGTVCPYKLCDFYAREGDVRLRQPVQALSQQRGKWQVNGEDFDAVILACGAGVLHFEQTDWLPVYTVRGQVLQFEGTDISKNLKTNLNYGGYVSPSKEGVHTCGSTFQKWLSSTDILEQDNRDILESLEAAVPVLSGLKQVVSARASLRTASKDRLPIIGCVPEKDISDGTITLFPNLYVSTAHGSHGIVTTYKAAQMILDLFLRNKNAFYAENLSASRFHERVLRKN